MVMDKIEDTVRQSLSAVKEDLKEIGRSVVLPEHVIALLEQISFDEMSYSDEIEIMSYRDKVSPEAAEQLQADLKRLPANVGMMVCPGNERQCGGDIVEHLGVSDRVPDDLRRRMHEAIDGWRAEMKDIAREATETYKVPMVVRYDLTLTGPKLALGYGRDHGHAHQAAAPPVPESE